MQKISHALLALPMIFLGSLANAQTAGTITFTANSTSATGSLTPRLTWSTQPVASSCTASGGWSGNKFASGSETLATITASRSYTLTCAWATGSATISWTRPTTNTDGSALTNLAGYRILFGPSASDLSQSMSVTNPSATSFTVPSLGAGTWYFAVRAVTSTGSESDNSSLVQKTITGVNSSRTINITINPTTPPPTNPPPTNPPPTGQLRVVSTPAYDVVMVNGVRTRGRVIGTIQIGTGCSSSVRIGTTNYYGVSSGKVVLTGTPRSNEAVAECRAS